MSVRVRDTITYYDDQTGGGLEDEDCAASPGACVLHVESQIDPNANFETPLVFDPNAPPVPQATMTIHPGNLLSDGQQINLDASGFLPNKSLAAVQCAGPVNEGSATTCGAFAGPIYVNSDAHGEVHLTVTAHQVFTTASGGTPIDCGFTPDNCRLVLAEVRGNTADASAMVSITFVPPVQVGGEVVTSNQAPPPDPSESAATSATALAFTGSNRTQPVALVGAAAFGLGGVLLLVARRRARHTL